MTARIIDLVPRDVSPFALEKRAREAVRQLAEFYYEHGTVEAQNTYAVQDLYSSHVGTRDGADEVVEMVATLGKWELIAKRNNTGERTAAESDDVLRRITAVERAIASLMTANDWQ